MNESDLPVPPPELMFRVSGGQDPAVFRASGKDTLEDFSAALASVGKTFGDFEHMLDFGCGCGRVLRWLEDQRPKRVSGTDYDAPAIIWLRDNIPGVEAKGNGPLPPLDFPDASFDLIIGYSVFSHFDVPFQDRWLAELRRVARPGAIVLLTIHGRHNWKYCIEHAMRHVPELLDLDAQLKKAGFLYWTKDGWDNHFPDFYHSAWHTEEYIKDHWSSFFEVLEVRSGGARPTQDMVVLRCPGTPQKSKGGLGRALDFLRGGGRRA